ncbi:MAG: Stf0 family sulfotransferase [Pseudomonadota bacterium]
MAKFDSFVICTSPRSGSTLLCRLLEETGVSGAPDSHFHQPSRAAWMEHFGVEERATEAETLAAVFARAVEKGRGGTDVFGLRLQRQSFAYFAETLRVMYPGFGTDVDRMEAAFGRTLFIHLTRENKLDQAISYVKAKQSGLWHRAPDGMEIERLSAPAEPVYDRAAIAAQLEASLRMDAEWVDWFSQEGIAPLRIAYDALSEDPHGARASVLDALGVAFEPVGDALPVARLADAVNAEWAKRFRREMPG